MKTYQVKTKTKNKLKHPIEDKQLFSLCPSTHKDGALRETNLKYVRQCAMTTNNFVCLFKDKLAKGLEKSS